MALGNQALVHGGLRLQAIYKAQRVSIHIHYLAVWVRPVRGPWQLLAWASTRLPH